MFCFHDMSCMCLSNLAHSVVNAWTLTGNSGIQDSWKKLKLFRMSDTGKNDKNRQDSRSNDKIMFDSVF